MMDSIQSVLKDSSVLNATIFCTAALSGQLLHAIKKWAEGEAWIMANLRRTVGAIIGNVTGMVGFVSTGALTDIPAIGTIIALGLFMGLSADSLLNKGSRTTWTDEERTAKAEK